MSRIPFPSAAGSAFTRSPLLGRSSETAFKMPSPKPLQDSFSPFEEICGRKSGVPRSKASRVVSMPCPRPAPSPVQLGMALPNHRIAQDSRPKPQIKASQEQRIPTPMKDITRRPRVVKRPSSEALVPMKRQPSRQRRSAPQSRTAPGKDMATSGERKPVALTDIPIPKTSSSILRPPTKQVSFRNTPVTVSTPRLAQAAEDVTQTDSTSIEESSLRGETDRGYVYRPSTSPDITSALIDRAESIHMVTCPTISDDSVILSRTGSSESLTRSNHIYDRHRRSRTSQDSLSGDSASTSSSGVSFFTDSSMARAKLEMVRKASILRTMVSVPSANLERSTAVHKEASPLHPDLLSALTALRGVESALQEEQLLTYSFDWEPSSPMASQVPSCWTDVKPAVLYLGTNTDASIFRHFRQTAAPQKEAYQSELDFLDEWDTEEQFLNSLGLDAADVSVADAMELEEKAKADLRLSDASRMIAVSHVTAAFAWMGARAQV